MPLIADPPVVKYNAIIGKAYEELETAQRKYGRGAIHLDMAKCYDTIGNANFTTEQYFEALKFYKKALAVRLEFYQNQAGHTPEVAHSYNLVGKTFVEMERYGKAHQNFLNALVIFKTEHGSSANHDDIAETYNFIAIMLRNQCNLAEAEEYHMKALTMVKDIYGANTANEIIAKTYAYYGRTMMEGCMYSAATFHYRTAGTAYRHVYADYFLNDPENMPIEDFARVMLERGDLEKMCGNHQSAYKLYTGASSQCKSHWGLDDETSQVFFSEIFDKVGQFNMSNFGLKHAEMDFDQSYALRHEFYDGEPHHAPLARSCINFGDLHQHFFEFEKAIKHYRNAYIIYEAIYSENEHPVHPNMARCLNHIADAQLQLACFRKALASYQEALALLQDFFGAKAHHPDIARTYQLIAIVYRAIGDYDKAHEFNKMALNMNKCLYKGNLNHMSIADNYFNYGKVYVDQGELQQASHYFNKAHDIFTNAFPEDANHQFAIDISLEMGQLHVKQDQLESSLTRYAQAVTMGERLYYDKHEFHPTLSNCYKLIGDTYADGKDYNSARQYYQKADKMYDEFHKTQNMDQRMRHPGKALTHLAIGVTYAKEEHATRAKKYFDGADALLTMTFGCYNDHPIRAAICKLKGDAEASLGHPRKALDFYQSSLQIRENLYGKDAHHPDIAESKRLVTHCINTTRL